MDAKGFYRILEVAQTASEKEIKDAFRRQAKLYHPDKNNTPQAAEKYLKINEAYRVLSDPEARKAYDNTAEDGFDFVPCSVCGIHAKQPRYVLFDEGGIFRSGVFCRPCASRQQFRSALKNWRRLLLHPVLSVKALINNRNVGEKPAYRNLELLMKNAAAFRHEKRSDLARFLAEQALNFTQNSAERSRIASFISALPDTVKRKDGDLWRVRWTDTFRVFLPLFLALIVVVAVLTTPVIRDSLNRSRTVFADYKHQPVIPVRFDPKDTSTLFHTVDIQTPVYQAPCLDCGIIDLLPEGTTVRITGLLPQPDWVQVMTPLGKIVFVKTADIQKGKGARPLPYRSKIAPDS